MGPNKHKIVAIAASMAMMVLWEAGEGGAMPCPGASNPFVIDDRMAVTTPWRNGAFNNLHLSYDAGGTAEFFINGSGTGWIDGGRNPSYGISGTWATGNPLFGNERDFALWPGALPQTTDLPSYCSEKEWSDYLHEQSSNSGFDYYNGEPERDNPVIEGSAVLFVLGSVMAAIFFWGNRSHPVSKSRNRREFFHRYER